jgi:hypothetical protein
VSTLTRLQTTEEVGADDVEHRLKERLGPRYQVTVVSGSTLKVGRPGVLPSKVSLDHARGGTTFSVHSTGLILSRLVQVAAVNRHVKRALADAYPSRPMV